MSEQQQQFIKVTLENQQQLQLQSKDSTSAPQQTPVTVNTTTTTTNQQPQTQTEDEMMSPETGDRLLATTPEDNQKEILVSQICNRVDLIRIAPNQVNKQKTERVFEFFNNFSCFSFAGEQSDKFNSRCKIRLAKQFFTIDSPRK